MPRGTKSDKCPADVIGNAVHVMRIVTGMLTCALVSHSAYGQKPERWTCTDQRGSTTWIIVGDRMLSEKGTIAMRVVANSPSLMVAYHLSKSSSGDAVISYVYILDKTGRTMVTYNDMTAAIFRGRYHQPFEASVEKERCQPG